MASVNRCIFIGNLTRDVDIKYMASGDAVANFSIACNENYKDKAGVKVEKVEYVNISTFKKLAEICGEYLKKGSSVYIEGKLQTRKWQDKEGKDRYTTEIIADRMQMLGGKSVGDSYEKPAQKPKEREPGSFDDFEDSIPY